MTDAATRRDALRSAALAAGLLATPALLRPATARAQEGEEDDEVLEEFLIETVVLEQITVIAYETAIGALADGGGLVATLERCADQDRAHARAMRSALDLLGVDPPDAPSGPDDAAAIEDVEELDDDRAAELVELLAELAELEGREAHLEHLLALEQELLDLYLRQTPEFVAEDLLRNGAEIAACEAQHVVVLREALGSSPAEAVLDRPAPAEAEPAGD